MVQAKSDQLKEPDVNYLTSSQADGGVRPQPCCHSRPGLSRASSPIRATDAVADVLRCDHSWWAHALESLICQRIPGFEPGHPICSIQSRQVVRVPANTA